MPAEVLSEKDIFYLKRFTAGICQINAVKIRFKQLFKNIVMEEDQKIIVMKRLRHEASYYARKFLKNNWIKENTYVYKGKITRGNPRTYHPTSFTPVISENIIPVMPEDLRWERETDVEIEEFDIPVHHISYKFRVLDSPKRNIHWAKGPDLLNGGIEQFYLYWPSKKDPDHVTIRYWKNPGGDDEIVIWFPVTVIPAGFHRKEMDLLNEHMYKYVAGVQRVLQCRLGIPEIYRHPHHCFPVREPEVREFIEKGNTISSGNVMMNTSNPKEGPMFESEKMVVTKCYSELPQRVLRVEDYLKKQYDQNIPKRIISIEENLERLAVGVNGLVVSQQKLIDTQQGLVGSQKELVEVQKDFQKSVMELVDIKKKKDKVREVEAKSMIYG